MYKLSVFNFHGEAYKIFFRNFFSNYFNYLVFGVFVLIASLNIILLPIVLLINTAYFVTFSERRGANLRGTIKNLDMDVNRYLNLFLISGLKRAVILTGYVLFLIPGIIFSFGLAPVSYNIIKKPDAKASEALMASWNSMKGFKWSYFAFLLVGYLPLLIYLLIMYLLWWNFIPITNPLLFSFLILLGLILIPAFLAELQLSKILFFDYISSEKTYSQNNFDTQQSTTQNSGPKLPF